MQYQIYRLSFPNGVHFGDGNLDRSVYSFSADTLFSSLYLEALKAGQKTADWFLQKVKEGSLLFSDAFPVIGDTYFLPKPIYSVRKEGADGDSVKKKEYKKLTHIPMDKQDIYMRGDLDPTEINDMLKKLGKAETKTSAAVSGKEDTLPYHVGEYRFHQDNGLFFVAALSDADDRSALYDLIEALSFSGIGGKRTAGYGRFDIKAEKTIDAGPFEKNGGMLMSLSISLPRNDEMERALADASYQIRKRSGFIQSATYADVPNKKRDLFMLSAGSCFKNRFEGDVYDVSQGGAHPVYRYGKPLFWAL